MHKRHYKILYIFLVITCLVMLIIWKKEISQREVVSFNWSSTFESGAVTDVHRRKDGSIGFSIPGEPGDGEYLWFYFNIQSDSKKPLEFVLENPMDAHQTGRRWNITRPVFSSDRKTWIKAEKSSYPLLRHWLWQHGIKLFGKPAFRFQAPFTAETLWVAYSYPYTYKDLNRFLEKIRDFPEVTISTIGKSEENRNLLKITINRTSLPADEKDSQVVWIVAREHPGETPSSFVCEGIIQSLLTSPFGKRLRETYAFNIIPMVNVDGVAHGYYYHNVNGINLALDWEDFASLEARVVRDALAESLQSRTLRLMINLHSSNDPTLGHYLSKMRESELKPEDVELQRNLFRVVNGIYPQLQGKSPVTVWDIPGVTCKSLYDHHQAYCLYLESNYSRGADDSVVTQESLRETGAAFVEALAKVLQ